MDISVLSERLGVMERALVGEPTPGGRPGIVEIQRRQGEDIKELRRSVDHLNDQVDNIRRSREEELAIRRGEQKMLRALKAILIVILTLIGAGGSVLGTRILSAISELAK